MNIKGDAPTDEVESSELGSPAAIGRPSGSSQLRVRTGLRAGYAAEPTKHAAKVTVPDLKL